MYPTLAPTPSNYDLNGNEIIIRPNGTDDWSNFQTIMNYAAGLSADQRKNMKYRVASGLYYFSGQVSMENAASGVMECGSGTTFVCGTASAPMQLLSAADRAKYNPSGWPSMFVCHESPTSPTPVNLTVNNLTVLGSDQPGYVGPAFGYSSYPNIGIEAAFKLTPARPVVSKLAQPVVMTGLVPHAVPDGDTDIGNVFVRSSATLTTTIYTEGVDYTVDTALGTISRLGGGAITGGQTVYVDYNNTVGFGLTASVGRLKMNNCTVRGGIQRVGGFDFPNIEVPVAVSSGQIYEPRQSEFDVYFGVTVPADIPGAFFDFGFGPVQHLNGSIDLAGLTVEDCNLGTVKAWMFNGVPPSAGDHIYPATADKSALIKLRNVRTRRAPFGGIAGASLTLLHCHGVDIDIDDMVAQTVAGGILMIIKSGAFTYSGVATTDACGLRIGKKGIRLIDYKMTPDEWGGTIYPVLIQLALGDPSDPAEGFVLSNVEAELKSNDSYAPAVNLEGSIGVVIQDCKFVTSIGVAGQDVIALYGATAGTIIKHNDFEGWQPSPGKVAVFIDSGVVDSKIRLGDNDLFNNLGGASNKITGGIQS